ncbi:glycosyltransferase family 2 protein [Sinomicrobium soli]|uniref:glycosyltransferase family 2 protein n=1 Tax=Sinomicrobium sp. N-1-3-6 TaxID=2219864 RepID=UPI000DCB808F|nr:glycosyltransferase family 2 protein [Sinomicrobium sp. N-1-3-6]RAV30465.1 glycosyltransferase family 2 protein [Sinomicrobium sp. N-1-3-6]
MKAKEYPVSVFQALKLSMLPARKLREVSRNNLPVIVSLTSIPSRIHKIHLTIRSILAQTRQPEKIILWLHEDMKGTLPKSLTQLESEVFRICFSPLTCSHKKLVHTLQQYPDKIVITCDDDFMYSADWVRLLYQEHLKYPENIIGNQTRYIRYDREGKLLSYTSWTYPDQGPIDPDKILPIGAEGVLYPPDCLYKEVNNTDLFLKLSPKADDLWFKCMSLLRGTVSRQAGNPPRKAVPVIGTQSVSLKKENIRKDKNREQWQTLTDYFDIELYHKTNAPENARRDQ